MLIGGSENTLAAVRSFGLPVDLCRWAELHDVAVGHQRRAPAQKKCLFRLGRGIDNNRAASGKQLGQLVAQFFAQFVIEIGQRFVEEHRGFP